MTRTHFRPLSWPAPIPLLTVVAGFAAHVSAQPVVTSLGALSGGNPSASYGESISTDGMVVVGSSSSSSGQRAFRWSAGKGIQNLGVLTGFTLRSYAAAANANGSVVVGASLGSGNTGRAYRWTSATGMQSLGVLGTGSSSGANAVNADGSVIVGFSYVAGFNGAVAMRWTSALGMQSLGGTGSNAAAVTPDGSVIVGADIPQGFVLPFRWTQAGGMQHLSIPAVADSGEAYAVSSDGSIAAGYVAELFNSTFSHASRWTGLAGGGPGTVQDLGALPGSNFAYAYALSADGSVVAGLSSLPAGDRAFVWTAATGMLDLNTYLPTLGADLTGWTLLAVKEVSSTGSALAGYGVFNGSDRAFLITGFPVPPPVPCYANCDGSTVAPRLTANDFQCFINAYAGTSSYANCDGSTVQPVLTANDFQCFINSYAAGCS